MTKEIVLIVGQTFQCVILGIKSAPSTGIGTSGQRCSRSTGNDVSGHYFHYYFLSSPSSPFLIEGVLGSKNLFSESCLKWPHYYREVISDF